MTPITDFSALFRAVESELADRLPQVNHLALLNAGLTGVGEVTLPAVLIEFAGAKPGKPYTAGRLPWRCQLRLHCLVSGSTPDAALAAANLGAAAAQVVSYRQLETAGGSIQSRQNWGLDGLSPVDILRLTMHPKQLTTEDKPPACVVVEFEQDIHLGDMLACPPDFLPDTVTVRSHYQTGVDAWTK